jgi:hypothetical protein
VVNRIGTLEPAVGGSLRAAVSRCIADLQQALTDHRGVMAAAEAERAALVAQLGEWERSGSTAGLSGARAMETLRARLAAAEQRAYDAGAAAEDCERALSGLSSARDEPSPDTGGTHGSVN